MHSVTNCYVPVFIEPKYFKDFNILVDTISNSEKFLNCPKSCNTNQHVHKPTHLHGDILDLFLISDYSSFVLNVQVVQPTHLHGHSLDLIPIPDYCSVSLLFRLVNSCNIMYTITHY